MQTSVCSTKFRIYGQKYVWNICNSPLSRILKMQNIERLQECHTSISQNYLHELCPVLKQRHHREFFLIHNKTSDQGWRINLKKITWYNIKCPAKSQHSGEGIVQRLADTTVDCRSKLKCDFTVEGLVELKKGDHTGFSLEERKLTKNNATYKHSTILYIWSHRV